MSSFVKKEGINKLIENIYLMLLYCDVRGDIMDFLIKIYAVIATIPFLTFFFIYFLLVLLGKPKNIAINRTIYITSLLLIGAVSSQLKYMFNLTSGLWFSLLIVFLIFIVLGFLQWKFKNKLDIKKLILSTLKLSFYLFGVLYISFFIVSLFLG